MKFEVECHNCERGFRPEDVYLLTIQRQEPAEAPREVYAFCDDCAERMASMYEMELPEEDECASPS